ncbi:26S proteasome non-ATPase regulatory subunit 8-like [Hydractinia symbiolongicarpus]|uniref:26S proteasome non-ATPase regulatory subunit 8-like n=1 Tax=Hydractinia symbiolongicarpus TaxID=13093 RepID=UPI00254D9D34|nr:26S proteasome non-ATPase regulatory subunit 8-like [Hydractinia symbiolongicarpus]
MLSHHILQKMAGIKMAASGPVVSMYQNLIKEWTKKPANLDNVGKLLTQLKLALTELQFMPTSGTNPSPQELVVARDVLEIGVQYSLERKDIPAFERYMSQLKCYYFDYSGVLAESPYLYQLLGLNLMCLLAQNRLAEFHTELELLPAKELQENVYIRCPVALEQYLMEGNYNKVFLSKGNVPAESYHFFINILLDTLRDEVAVCIEKSYNRISQKEACRMLFFDKQKDLLSYTGKRNWELDVTKNYIFQSQVHQQKDIPSLKIIEHCLSYAKELERIV